MSSRRGVTLVELMVVIALLSVIAAVGGLALRRSRRVSGASATVAAIAAARDSALRSGRAVTITFRDPTRGARRSLVATAFPDGRVLGDPALGIDPLTGRVLHAAR